MFAQARGCCPITTKAWRGRDGWVGKSLNARDYRTTVHLGQFVSGILGGLKISRSTPSKINTRGIFITIISQQWLWKPHKITDSAKESSNCLTIALISHASKVMLNILQVRLQQYVNWDIPDVQAGFRKGRGTRDQIANIRWIIQKPREFQKKHLLLLHWLC